MLYYGLEQHSLDSYFQFKELGSAPSTPTTNEIRLYAKDDGSGVSTLCYKNDAGTEICFPSSGTIVTGTGVSGRLAFWNGTSTLTSDADLTFSVDTLTATKIIAPTSITISTLTSGSLVFAGASGLLSQDNSNLFWDDTNNRLGIGTTTPERTLHAVLSGSATQPIGAHNYSGGATTPINGVLFRSARGTVGSPTAVQADDTAVVLAFQGYGATGFSASKRASVEMLPGENWTDAAQGTYLRFLTTALTGTTTAEKFRIGPSGQWGIGGATFGTALDVFTSGGASAAPTWTSPGALTKVDDTNVTLTLGGTPATALLRAASLTLGWTGQLAVSRGGTGLSSISGDWLSQYALLAGRSGGQILKGGTAAADTLALRATAGVGAGSEALIFQVGNNGASEIGRFTPTGLIVGSSSVTGSITNRSTVTTTGRGLNLQQYSADIVPGEVAGQKSRNTTVGSHTAVLSGDNLLSIGGAGSDGSAFSDNVARFLFQAAENFSATNQGTKVLIQTTPLGSTVAGRRTVVTVGDDGSLDVVGVYKANGTSGVASFGPSAVASITVKNGIITAIS